MLHQDHALSVSYTLTDLRYFKGQFLGKWVLAFLEHDHERDDRGSEGGKFIFKYLYGLSRL